MKIPITEEIRQNLEWLSPFNVRFLENAERFPQYQTRSEFKQITNLELIAGRYGYQPWPTFLSPTAKQQFAEAGQQVLDLIRAIPQRIFNHNIQEMSRHYHIPVHQVEYLMQGFTQAHLKQLMGRGDFLKTSTGLKCVEFNVSATVGGWEVAFLEPVYLKHPLIANFIRENGVKLLGKNEQLFEIMLENALEAAWENFTHQYSPAGAQANPFSSKEINIAVVSPTGEEVTSAQEARAKEFYLNHMYSTILKKKYPSCRGEILFCDFPDLHIKEGFLFYQQKQIHIIIERHLGNVPLHILQLFNQKNIVLMNPPVGNLLDNKISLALLSQYKDSPCFSQQERESIQRYIPWTRKITPGTLTYHGHTLSVKELILTQQEQLVIKPSDALGGDGVFIGRNTTPNQWQQVIELALMKGNWLVQEYMESTPYLFQCGEYGCELHNAVWGFFVFGSRYAGVFPRILSTKNSRGVINTRQGAEENVVLEVDE